MHEMDSIETTIGLNDGDEFSYAFKINVLHLHRRKFCGGHNILVSFLLFYFFTFFCIQIEESIGFVQIFEFRFLVDLCVLECPEHDLTISGKCLSVCYKNSMD